LAGRNPVRATFLTLRNHGKVYVADLPRLSDGQLAHVRREAGEVLDSLRRRLQDLDQQMNLTLMEQETRIRAGTKLSVTERFIEAVEEELEQRRNNPALRAAAGESVARAFMEVARHRLPGATFDSLLQEALSACGTTGGEDPRAEGPAGASAPLLLSVPRPASLPVVLTPDPSSELAVS
jgi:hypothetical protein